MAELKDVIPDGRFVFPVDPACLRYHPGGVATNDIVFDTAHLNGGHYVITTDFSLIQFLSHQERTIVATSQEEADRLAQEEYGVHVNHDRPDAAIFANLISGLPDDTTRPQTITLTVPVMNVGAVPLAGATVHCTRSEADAYEPLAPPQTINTRLAPREEAAVSFSFAHDGKPLQVRLLVEADGPDACWDNDRHLLTLGAAGPGRVEVIADDEATYSVCAPHTGEAVLTLTPGAPMEIPAGAYDLRDAAGEVVHPVFGVRSNDLTRVDLAAMGTVTVITPKTVDLTFTGDAATVTAPSNAPFRLPPGWYRVDGGKDLFVPDITVRRARAQTVRADAAGWIEGDGFHDRFMYRRLRAFDIHGREVASTLESKLKLRPGTYTLRKQHAYLEQVAVRAGKTTPVTLRHAGGIRVESVLPKMNKHYFHAFDANGRRRGRMWVNSMTAVPVGTYTVEVHGNTYEDVKVEDGEITTIALDGWGALEVAHDVGCWVQVLDINGEPVKRGYRGEYIYLRPGTYSAKLTLPNRTLLGVIEDIVITENELTNARLPVSEEDKEDE
ncbi:MAG: hypothetical protein ACOCZK_03540 [Planctomycetota bacterium]